MQCTECEKPADAPPEQQSKDYPICKVCLSANWITDSEEIRKAILEDPELKGLINHESPYGG